MRRLFVSLATVALCMTAVSAWRLTRPWNEALPEPAVVGGPCVSPQHDVQAMGPGTPAEEVKGYFGGRAMPLLEGAREASCIVFACNPNSPVHEHFVNVVFPLEDGKVRQGSVHKDGIPSECQFPELVFVGNRPQMAFAK